MIDRILIAAACASMLVACISRPPVDHFVGILDELTVPTTWVLAHEAVRAPGSTFISCDFLVNSDCPSVHRYFVVDGPLKPALLDAKAMLLDAGFRITEVYQPDCDKPYNGGLAACRVEGVRDQDRVNISFLFPGLDTDELGIAQPGRSIVELRAFPIPMPAGTGGTGRAPVTLSDADRAT